MKERGIIFSGAEVLALLAGRKTQTRRIAKPSATGVWNVARCPHGAPGDRLWIKEAFNWSAREELVPGEYSKLCPERTGWRAPFCVYRADGIKAHPEHPEWGATIWNPSTRMPRWASRITLEITGLRVQRLQDITEEDARAEGIEVPAGADACPCQGEEEDPGPAHLDVCPWRDPDIDPTGSPHRDEFAILWNKINGKRAPWSSNPWVWVLEFKRVEEASKVA